MLKSLFNVFYLYCLGALFFTPDCVLNLKFINNRYIQSDFNNKPLKKSNSV
jgi:hypothetical protein